MEQKFPERIFLKFRYTSRGCVHRREKFPTLSPRPLSHPCTEHPAPVFIIVIPRLLKRQWGFRICSNKRRSRKLAVLD